MSVKGLMGKRGEGGEKKRNSCYQEGARLLRCCDAGVQGLVELRVGQGDGGGCGDDHG